MKFIPLWQLEDGRKTTAYDGVRDIFFFKNNPKQFWITQINIQ